MELPVSDQPNSASDAQIASGEMVVGVFSTPHQAEQTVLRLIEAGVAAEQVSVIASDSEANNRATGFLTTGHVARNMACIGAWVGGLFGLLAGGTTML